MYVDRCHKSRGPWIRFHVPPRRHPYSARDVSCSLVLRVGSCQLMRIQGLRAVTKVHRQFCRTKGAHVKVYPSRRLPFRVVVHNANLDLAPKRLLAFFRSLHAVGTLCSAPPPPHADVCRSWFRQYRMDPASTLHHSNITILWAIPVAASCCVWAVVGDACSRGVCAFVRWSVVRMSVLERGFWR